MKKIFILLLSFFVLLSCGEKSSAKKNEFLVFTKDIKRYFCLKDENFYFYIEYFHSVDDFMNSKCKVDSEFQNMDIKEVAYKLTGKNSTKIKELQKKKAERLSSCKEQYNLLYDDILKRLVNKSFYFIILDNFSVETAAIVKSSEITFFMDISGKKYKTKDVFLLERTCPETKECFN